MKNAPAVFMPVGRFAMDLRWKLPGLGLLSLWLWQPWSGHVIHGGSAMFWGAVGLQALLLVIALPARGRQEICQLHWDGESWHGETASGPWRPVSLEVHADGQRWLWLAIRLQPEPGATAAPSASTWILARASDKPLAWHGFRCAVYCRTKSPAGRLPMTA